MENVEIIEHFVNVKKDGLDDFVQLNILRYVHQIHYHLEN
jgi:hypothetical protein